MRPWYCARTEPNKEFEARRQLERRGFVVFLPTYLKKYESRNTRLRLLFRNYIFVSFDDPNLWPEVTHTPGILSVITHQPEHHTYLMPSPICSDAIETLRQQALAIDEVSGGASNHPQQYITAGTYVKVISGYFQGEAQTQKALVHWADHERATLLLNMFNRQVSVQFYQKELEKVDAA
jgi:transcription antitermination factor NusG